MTSTPAPPPPSPDPDTPPGAAAKILLAHPGAERYGSDRMLLESVVGLLARGDSVRVALPADGPLAEDLRAAGACVDVVRSPVLRKSALRPAGFARLLWQSVRAIRPTLALLRWGPDVVYVSTLTIPLWVVLARLTGRRCLVHVHEAEQHPNRLIGLGLVAPLALAEKILVNSEFSTEVLLASLPRLRTRAQVVLNGVEGPAAPTPARARLSAGLRILYVGRLSPRKGPHVLLAATRALHERGVDVQLRLLGDVFAGYEAYAAGLRADHADLVEAGTVRFLGFRDDIWPELAWADVAVVPSVLPEPFGNTAVEAALAGRPVIVSDIGGLPEAVKGLRAVTAVPADDAAALADALAQLAQQWPAPGRIALEDVAKTRQRYATTRYQREVAEAVHSMLPGGAASIPAQPAGREQTTATRPLAQAGPPPQEGTAAEAGLGRSEGDLRRARE